MEPDANRPGKEDTSRPEAVRFGIGLVALGVASLAALVSYNPPLRAAAASLAPVAYGIVFLLSIAGLGSLPARWLLGRPDPPLHATSAVVLGMGISGTVTLALAALGITHPLAHLAYVAAGVVLGVLAAWAWWRPGSASPEAAEGDVRSPWNVLGFALLALTLVPLLPFVAAPEASVDALAYHLLIPKLWIESGGLVHLPYFVESNYPFLAELLYVPVLLLGDEIPCKGLHFGVGLVLLVAIADLASALGGRRAGVLASGLFASMPVVAIHAAWAWNDLMFVLAVVTALRLLVSAAPGGRAPAPGAARAILAAGLCFGVASWLKYTFVLYLPAMLLAVAWGVRRDGWLRRLVAFSAGVMTVAPLWLVKNWAFTGNPFQPFLSSLFPTAEWTAATAAYFHDAVRSWEIAGWTLATYVAFPVHVALRPRLVDIHTGIAPILLLPLMAVPARGDHAAALRVTRAFLAGGLATWLVLHTENRSLLSLIAVELALGAAILGSAPVLPAACRLGLTVVLVAAAAVNTLQTQLVAFHLFSPHAYFFERESREAYLARVAGHQEAFQLLHGRQDVGRVLLVSVHEPYYLERPYVFSAFADVPAAERIAGGSRTAADVAARMRREGITHLVLHRAAYERQHASGLYAWPPHERAAFEAFLREGCQRLGAPAGDEVYRLRPPQGPAAAAGPRFPPDGESAGGGAGSD